MKVTINGTEYVPATFRPNDAMPINRLFIMARRRLEVTMAEVAQGTGLAISTICNAESGSAVTLVTAIKLCRFYKIDLERLADSVCLHGIPNDRKVKK